jgi:hypothetical protein
MLDAAKFQAFADLITIGLGPTTAPTTPPVFEFHGHAFELKPKLTRAAG